MDLITREFGFAKIEITETKIPIKTQPTQLLLFVGEGEKGIEQRGVNLSMEISPSETLIVSYGVSLGLIENYTLDGTGNKPLSWTMNGIVYSQLEFFSTKSLVCCIGQQVLY